MAIYYLQFPTNSNSPLEDTAYSYAISGMVEMPWFDGRFAEITGTALRVTIVAEGLTATEYIEVYYRTVRGAAYTYLGRINSTTSYLDFGAAAVGLPFKIIQLQFYLVRGNTTTLTPIIQRIVFQYLKKPPVRYRYTASIEVKGTRSGLRSMETILAELETAYDATTLQALAYGRVSTKVNLVGLNFVEKPPPQKTGQRNVWQIQVAMEEPL
jgi:hypothetical protein